MMMEIRLKDNRKAYIRPYDDEDFSMIQALNKAEGWTNLVENHLNTKEAWENSNVAYVVEKEEKVIGYVRGLTDKSISLYICELLINKKYRGLGLGKEMIRFLHHLYPNTRMELLANSSSRSYYEGLGFRTFYGFRKTSQE